MHQLASSKLFEKPAKVCMSEDPGCQVFPKHVTTTALLKFNGAVYGDD